MAQEPQIAISDRAGSVVIATVGAFGPLGG